jgi:hypothetical protein
MSQFAQIEATARAAAAAVLQEALDRINSLEAEVVKLKDRLSPAASKTAAAPAAKGTTAQAGAARGSGKANG